MTVESSGVPGPEAPHGTVTADKLNGSLSIMERNMIASGTIIASYAISRLYEDPTDGEDEYERLINLQKDHTESYLAMAHLAVTGFEACTGNSEAFKELIDPFAELSPLARRLTVAVADSGLKGTTISSMLKWNQSRLSHALHDDTNLSLDSARAFAQFYATHKKLNTADRQKLIKDFETDASASVNYRKKIRTRTSANSAVAIEPSRAPVVAEELNDALSVLENNMIEVDGMLVRYGVSKSYVHEEDGKNEFTHILDLHEKHRLMYASMADLAILGFDLTKGKPGALEEITDTMRDLSPIARLLTTEVKKSGLSAEFISGDLGWSPAKISRGMNDGVPLPAQESYNLGLYLADKNQLTGVKRQEYLKPFVAAAQASKNYRRRMRTRAEE